jgi:hypothetical protein
LKTINTEKNYEFRKLVRYNNQLYFICCGFSHYNAYSLYLWNVITEEKFPLCKHFQNGTNTIEHDDRIFHLSSYRIDNPYYVTSEYPIVYMLPFSYPESHSYTENLGINLFTGEIISHKSSNRRSMPDYGDRHIFTNKIACIAHDTTFYHAGNMLNVDIQVFQQYIKMKRDFKPHSVIIFQPEIGCPKVFELSHLITYVALHPTEPIALAWNASSCTLIDLEL